MGAPAPQFIPEAFALNADGAHRNTIPATTANTQRASFNLGFPPLTMTPVIAGGKPMLGPDMNGILYMISSHTVYQQSGMPYRWNADVVTAIAGYAAGTLLGSTDNVTLWLNLTDGNSTDPDAGGAGWVPMFSYGITTLPPSAGGVITLTAAQATKPVIVISGALAANLQVVFPTQLRRWLVVNSTSGAFTVTAKTAGSGVPIPQGGFTAPTEVYGDGTNLYNVVAPITLPTDVSPSANSIALRSNNGYLYATYFNQNSPVENFSISEVFAGSGDGFLRKINKANFAANFLLSQFAGQVANGQVPQSAVTQYAAAILANAILTGVPTAATAAVGSSGSQVATLSFANPLASVGGINGYAMLPSGLKIQYGTRGYPAGSNSTNVVVTLPIACSVGCWVAIAIPDSGATLCNIPTKSTTSFTVSVIQRENGGGFAAGNIFWIALGL